MAHSLGTQSATSPAPVPSVAHARHAPGAHAPASSYAGRVPSRFLTSMIAAAAGVVILLEPYFMQTTPGLQIFQAGSMFWFWALFMFSGPSDT